jgi:hypothetical protein
MLHFVPMLVLMAGFGAIGVYWTIGTRHFIVWSRSYSASFTNFPADSQHDGNSQNAMVIKQGSGVILFWGVRLIGFMLAFAAIGSIVSMLIHG